MIQSSPIRVTFGTDVVRAGRALDRPPERARRERIIRRSWRQVNVIGRSSVDSVGAIQRFEYHRRGRRHVREIVEKSNNEKKQGQAHPRPRGGSRYPLPCDKNPRGGRSIRLSAIRSRR